MPIFGQYDEWYIVDHVKDRERFETQPQCGKGSIAWTVTVVAIWKALLIKLHALNTAVHDKKLNSPWNDFTVMSDERDFVLL